MQREGPVLCFLGIDHHLTRYPPTYTDRTTDTTLPTTIIQYIVHSVYVLYTMSGQLVLVSRITSPKQQSGPPVGWLVAPPQSPPAQRVAPSKSHCQQKHTNPEDAACNVVPGEGCSAIVTQNNRHPATIAEPTRQSNLVCRHTLSLRGSHAGPTIGSLVALYAVGVPSTVSTSR
ncbi:hypothetical protein LY78DRAFT_379204 [Colletotrichum sublineola]|nr:hypothetical protein LY78DRAFT_379204 [Colletotrichum sublineola]